MARSHLWAVLVRFGIQFGMLGGVLLASRADADESDPPAAGAVDVEPFGGLTWGDSFAQVITKLHQLGKVDSLVVAVNSSYSASFQGLTTAPAINHALEQLMRKAGEKKGAFTATFQKLKDPHGEEWLYLPTVKVTVKGVSAAGMLMNLEVDLVASPGVVTMQPANVSWFKGKPMLAAPLYIDEVSLERERSLTDTQSEQLHAAIKAKYPTLSNSGSLDGAEGSVGTTMTGVSYRVHGATRKAYKHAALELQRNLDAAGKTNQADKL